jgi:hypothetical protein
MKWFWFILGFSIFLIISAGVNFFYQKEIVDFFNSIGWSKMVGFFSGAWWSSIPTLMLAAGVIVAIWQIIEARKSTNAQTAITVFRELRNPETVEKLRLIYYLSEDELKNISIEQRKETDHLIDQYGALEVWVDNGIIDKKIAMEAGPAALRCWYRLHSYIKSTRNKRGYYGDNFEALVRLALDHFRKNKLRVQFWPAGHPDEDINLIIELEKAELRPRSLQEIKRDRKKGESLKGL